MDLAAQLTIFEGSRASVYPDHLGYLTIGSGICIDERKKCGLYPEEISFLLENRIRRIRESLTSVLPWYSTLSEPRRAVLEGMAFQMGVDGLLTFHRVLGSVENARYSEAAREMMQSLWARQTPKRATCLAAQMETGEWVVPEN